MEALLRANLPCDICAVISNNPKAEGLAIAKDYGVVTEVVDHKQYNGRESFDAALSAAVKESGPDVIALAGFMRILTKTFLNNFEGKVVNIHPSLLPSFPGLDTHAKAIKSGSKLHGCTTHLVTPELDCGPIIAQGALRVDQNDTVDTLAKRVLRLEHLIYPKTVKWLLKKQYNIRNGNLILDASVQDDSFIFID